MIPKLTPEQGAIITAYTGILSCDPSYFHRYAEKLLGHAIYTHEFAYEHLWVKLQHASRDSFMAMLPACAQPPWNRNCS